MQTPAIQKQSMFLNYHWQFQVKAIEFQSIKFNKMSSSKQRPNHYCICKVKHGSKLDNDSDMPWTGCSVSKCKTWLYLSYHLCWRMVQMEKLTGSVRNNTQENHQHKDELSGESTKQYGRISGTI